MQAGTGDENEDYRKIQKTAYCGSNIGYNFYYPIYLRNNNISGHERNMADDNLTVLYPCLPMAL